ncbi:signal recognition particle protein Srp19 [Candidatus Micrarchaeota archaeon CG10_big_fil_rev_8_21_14_0_10_45_29]|nr:MAG: signal recognition particle protein Srp19 [Candidatus Micrarchaeota archaeon CG10_big_fil_rev_8_21_14_0_10_45_29]
MDLGKGLRDAFRKLTGQAIVDGAAVKDFLRQIQRVLIANDVPVKLVFALTKNIEKKVLNENAAKGLSLREQVVRVVYEELVALLGEEYVPPLKARKILLLGLYGSGKTTTAGKIAHFYKSRGLSVGLIACDTDRPAAFEQLQQLAQKSGSDFYGIKGEKDVGKIIESQLPNAKEDLIIVDSAGRSGFDEELVKQLKLIADKFAPDEKILVMSGDIGQVAGRQAKQFNDAVGLSGVILTKMDGSGKGGGALAACHEAGVPVLFVGLGESMDALKPFNSKKFVGELLGFADFEGLIEKIKKVATEEKLEAEGIEELTLDSFYKQLKAAKKMGPLDSVLGMMGVSDLPKDALKTSEEKLKKYEAIISSMSAAERKDAKLLKKGKGRILRVAKGSGTSEKDVRELLNHFEKISNMMGGFKKNRGLRKKMEKFMKGKNIDMDSLGSMMGKQ